jgi:methylthioribose-1-phosphate isomerase
MLEHIRFDRQAMLLELLDQRILPAAEQVIACRTVDEVIGCIRDMVVRGAPAIGVSAAWGCVLAAAGCQDRATVLDDFGRLAAARPTAVNLRLAVDRMGRAFASVPPSEPAVPALIREAEAIQEEDIAACRAIGRLGGTLLKDGDTVLTHCNAGALATAGYGTALGIVRGAIEAGKRIRVIADETRPFLQGARLTAYELARDDIPVRVACDNACALLMHKGMVNCVVVGADRIAANGDAANKIGTLGVAILANHFGIPFYVAAPCTTIDPSTPNGDHIPIEIRPDREVTHMGNAPLTPAGVPVCNFAFDVTPADIITAIVTERGILRPPYSQAIAGILP